jgi:hypothetical protein
VRPQTQEGKQMTITTGATPDSGDRSKALVPFKVIRDVVAAYPADRFHLLLPTTYLGSSSLFIATPTAVIIDPDDERDVYKTPGSRDNDDSICFHATALQRLANAGGIDFDPSLTRHRHDREKTPLVCEQIAAGWYIDSIGQRRLISSPWVTHDLRDGSPRARLAHSPKQLEVGRQFICEQCGARARSSAIRKALDMKSSYKKSELYWLDQVERDGKQVTLRRPKPFVALRFRLDEADPDVKRALIARGVGAAQEIFGAAETRELPEPAAAAGADALEDVVDGEIIDVETQQVVLEAEPPIGEVAPAPKAEAPTRDANAVAAAATSKAKAITDAQGKASDEYLAHVGAQLRDALQLAKLESKGQIAVRLAIARGLYGASIKSVRELTTAQARVVVEMTKEPEGQRDLETVLRDRLVLGDPGLAPFAELLKPHLAHA